MMSQSSQVNPEANVNGSGRRVNGYIVTAKHGPTFITDNQEDAYKWALTLIDKDLAPNVAPYSVIPGGK